MKHYLFTVLHVIYLFSGASAANHNDKPIAENFTATTQDGRQISLEALKGKVAVLTF